MIAPPAQDMSVFDQRPNVVGLSGKYLDEQHVGFRLDGRAPANHLLILLEYFG